MPHVPGHVEAQQPATAGQSFLDRLGDLFADVLNQTNQGMQQNINPLILNRQKTDYQQALKALATLMQSNFFEGMSDIGGQAMQGLQTQGQGMQDLGNIGQQMVAPSKPNVAPSQPQQPVMNPQAFANFSQRSTPPKMPMQQIPPGY